MRFTVFPPDDARQGRVIINLSLDELNQMNDIASEVGADKFVLSSSLYEKEGRNNSTYYTGTMKPEFMEKAFVEDTYKEGEGKKNTRPQPRRAQPERDIGEDDIPF